MQGVVEAVNSGFNMRYCTFNVKDFIWERIILDYIFSGPGTIDETAQFAEPTKAVGMSRANIFRCGGRLD
jgi:hypothetical protein